MTIASRPLEIRGNRVVSAAVIAAIAIAAGFGGGFVVASGAHGFALATGLAVAAVGCLVVATRPTWGAYALVAVVPAVSGLGRGYPIPGFRLSEILTVSVGGVLLFAAVLRRDSFNWTRFDGCAALYAATALVTGSVDVLRGSPGGFSASNVGTIIGPVQFVLLYLAVKVTVKQASERRLAVGLLIASNVAVAMLGIAQRARLFGLDHTLPRITGSTVTNRWSFVIERRVTSVFPQWQMLSAFEYIVLILTVNLLMRKQYSGTARIAAGVAAAVTAVCLVETVTLTTTAASVAAILILAAWNRKLTRAAAVLVAAATVLGVFFATLIKQRYTRQYNTADNGLYTGILPHSFAFRIHVWVDQWIPIISNHLLTGIGPLLPSGGIWSTTESLYVTLLLRGGVPLLASYVILMVAWFGMALRAAHSEDRTAAAIGQVLVVVVVLLVAMQFSEPYFVDTGFPQVMWALAGLIAASVPLAPRTRDQEAL